MPNVDQYPKSQPHEAIEEIFPDVFLVHGSVRMLPGMRMNRNMVVLRQGDALTLISPVRLSAEGEAALDALGRVRHVMRIGVFHGLDDPYYVEHYGAEFWSQAGSDHYKAPSLNRVLVEGGPLPVEGAELFAFRETRFPECALRVPCDGGLLITCDSLQYHTDWSYCTLPARAILKLVGFSPRMLVGPPWRKYMTPRGASLRPDFERLLALEFQHLVGAHGRLCRAEAWEKVSTAVIDAFGE